MFIRLGSKWLALKAVPGPDGSSVCVARKRTGGSGTRDQPTAADGGRTESALCDCGREGKGPGTRSGRGQGPRRGGRLGTHADVQVLQEVLQQAGAQAERPHPLMAPGGLDPRAQVLGETGALRRCRLGGQPRKQEPVGHGQVSVPARRPFPALRTRRPSQRGSRAARHLCPSLSCWPGSRTRPSQVGTA